MSDWYIYQGNGEQQKKTPDLPVAPRWRQLDKKDRDVVEQREGRRTVRRHVLRVSDEERIVVNAAIYLRRPLLVTGLPGTGKSSLARAIAYELNLGEVLQWSITSRATINEALYVYDAIGRLQAASLARRTGEGSGEDTVPDEYHHAPPIQQYLRLGPLGTALATSTAKKPRVLLIDEFDKGDIDLPNDLLNIFERGEFSIPELARLNQEKITIRPSDSDEETVEVERGRVPCKAFPIVVITSNEEREFPAPFMRRCLQLRLELPKKPELQEIVRAHFDDLDEFSEAEKETVDALIDLVMSLREPPGREYVSADQLLNAVHLVRTADVDLKTNANHVLTPIAEVE